MQSNGVEVKLISKLNFNAEWIWSFNSRLRIPVWGSILLTEEVREIIDTKEFQRLRGIKQLGPTIFVFPGTSHTRFEHSLGAYHLVLRYLNKLLKVPEFVSVEEIWMKQSSYLDLINELLYLESTFFDLYVYVPIEIPLENDGIRPADEAYRLMVDDK